MKIYFIAIVTLALTLGSCRSNKNELVYFNNIDSVSTAGLAVKHKQKIIIGDELKIIVNSSVPEAAAHFNVPLVSVANKDVKETSKQSSMLQTYVVDENGDINFPVLGKLKVEGMTTTELQTLLVSRISEEVKEPFVSVYLTNYRVNVLGEVKEPGTKEVTKERYSVLDALADAEDITIYGRRDNVLVIREENGKMVHHRLNLQDAQTYSSPYFYLQQNDVVFVEPNKIQKDNSKYNQNNAFKLSVISTIVSAASVIASLVIALAIK